VVLRRQSARIMNGRPQGGYTDAFELTCCHCGDDPDLDYYKVWIQTEALLTPCRHCSARSLA
jgi:hypothetical protein